ncbi:MAG: DUF3488 domain-containing protein, partial [Planctomycetales bacterium]|nr:DUF3488 domain-containing protein [Planctomycetales bacterium]
VLLDRRRPIPPPPLKPHLASRSAAALPAAWGPHALPRRVVQRALGDGLVTIGLTLVCFLLLPRAGEVRLARGVPGQRIVGFTDTVKLGDLGQSIENSAAVMRVWFRDPQKPQPYRVYGTPLFRGTVVNHYEDRTWTLRFRTRHGHQITRLGWPEPDDGRPILQQISIEPQREATVCVIPPVFEAGRDV